MKSVVREPIAASGIFEGIKTSPTWNTPSPSIASQMKAFDAEGFRQRGHRADLPDRPCHSFDDIPTIVGPKSSTAS